MQSHRYPPNPMDNCSSELVSSLSEPVVVDVTYDMPFSTSSHEWISVPIVQVDSRDIEIIRAVARESITSAPVQPSKTDNDGLKEAQSSDHAAKISNKEVGRVEGNPKVAIATKIENKESTAVLPPLKRQKTEDCSEESGLPAN